MRQPFCRIPAQPVDQRVAVSGTATGREQREHERRPVNFVNARRAVAGAAVEKMTQPVNTARERPGRCDEPSAYGPDLPVEAAQPARHRLIRLGFLQWAQTVGAHLNDLVPMPPTGLLDPGHPRPPGTIAFVPLPREQMTDHAA